jgi:hypothetical protein
MGSALSGIFWSAPDYDESDNECVAQLEPGPPSVGLKIFSLRPERRYPRIMPLNLEDAAAVQVTHMDRVELHVEDEEDEDDEKEKSAAPLLVVGTWNARNADAAPRCGWPLLQDMRQLADDVRSLMQEDGVKRIGSAQELCVRYPGHFWNLVFHYEKRADAVYEFISREFCQK